jgi:hypothetical protein
MKKLAAFPLIIMVLAISPAHAQRRPSLIPVGWKQIAVDQKSKTRRFESPDGWVTLTTRQARANRSDLTEDIDEFANRPGEFVTYQRRGKTWIAVSGYRSDNIFYRKSNLACGGTRWNQVEFIYPRAEKERLDATVTAIARNMNKYSDDCG